MRTEVSGISGHGMWVLVGDRELFLSFTEFPWFIDVPVRKLLRVESPHPTYLRWPDLDVDVSIESIEHPERFPLVSRPRVGGSRRKARAGARAGRASATRGRRRSAPRKR